MFDDFMKKNKSQFDRMIDDRIGLSNRSRRGAEQKKGARNTASAEGVPLDSHGADGDITIRKTSSGIVLYAKYKGAWYGVELSRVISRKRGLSKLLSSDDSTSGIKGALNKVIEKVNK